MKLSLPPPLLCTHIYFQPETRNQTNHNNRNSNKTCSLKVVPEWQAASEWKPDKGRQLLHVGNMMAAILILIYKDIATMLLLQSLFSWSHHQCSHWSNNSMTLNWVVEGRTSGYVWMLRQGIVTRLFSPPFPKYSLHLWWVDAGQMPVHPWEILYSFSSQRITSVANFFSLFTKNQFMQNSTTLKRFILKTSARATLFCELVTMVFWWPMELWISFGKQTDLIYIR